MKPTLLILAAGLGSRYGGLKQIDCVGPSGEKIIDYSIYDAIRTGFGKVVLVIRKDIARIVERDIVSKFVDKIQIEYVFQDDSKYFPSEFTIPDGRVKPWGTGHAVFVAKDLINESFAVINADDFYGMESFQILGKHLVNMKIQKGGIAKFFTVNFQLSNTLSEMGSVSRGVCEVDDDGYLTDITETHNIKKIDDKCIYLKDGEAIQIDCKSSVSMQMFGFTPVLFKYLELGFAEFLKKHANKMDSEFLLPSVVSNMISIGVAKVKVLRSKSKWFGVTYKEDKEVTVNSIANLVRKGIYPVDLG